MGGRIFHLGQDGTLDPMIETPYEAESLLQELLAEYPDLLAGEQVDPVSPRRWLLLKRETGVPKEEGGGSHWSIDHLFVDQDGVPTLVEVKRAANTQIRRDVVGQMLDYAANGTAYWSLEQIRAVFERQCEKRGLESGAVLTEFLGSDSEAEEFWTVVKTNLQAGRVRMVFVADEIPSELRRIVEFLNAQMDPADVLALEVRQYVGQQRRTLVPRVFGLTAEAEKKKSQRTGIPWDEQTFLELLSQQRGDLEREAAFQALRWADHQLRISWGSGKRNGSWSPKLDRAGTTHNMFTMWTDGGIQVQFSSMHSPPFSDFARRLELLHRLNQIAGVELKESSIDQQWPTIKLARLIDPASMRQFLEAWDWFIVTVMNPEHEVDVGDNFLGSR